MIDNYLRPYRLTRQDVRVSRNGYVHIKECDTLIGTVGRERHPSSGEMSWFGFVTEFQGTPYGVRAYAGSRNDAITAVIALWNQCSMAEAWAFLERKREVA